MIDTIIGPQWGDEGKGKIVDYFARSYDLGLRYQGGNNAGHSLVIEGKTIVLHTVPSTIFTIHSLIGDGVVVNPVDLKKEIEQIMEFGGDPKKNLFIGNRAHLILPTHILLDKADEISKGGGKIGSTQKGITPVYRDRTSRCGVTTGDILTPTFRNKVAVLVAKHIKELSLYDLEINKEELDKQMEEFFVATKFMKQYTFVSCPYFLNDVLKAGKKVLAEGAQATMLDLSFGTYPYVTSSRTLATAIPSELGVPAHYLKNVIGVFKAYLTKVGAGPFPTKIEGDTAKKLQDAGHEFGSTTGRPRDTGWLDLPLLKYAIMINGITELVMTKLDIFDVLTEDIKVCTHYKINDRETDKVDFNLVSEIENIEPVYKEFKSWNGQTSVGMKKYGELPAEAKAYIEFVEKEVGIPISIISVGPGKDDLILK